MLFRYCQQVIMQVSVLTSGYPAAILKAGKNVRHGILAGGCSRNMAPRVFDCIFQRGVWDYRLSVFLAA